MRPLLRTLLLLALLGLGVGASVALGASDRPVHVLALSASVGPTASISMGGTGALTPGSYDINVNDKSAMHNFHLTGPGVDKQTGVGSTGTETWSVTLQVGHYEYHCDAHPSTMHGGFDVTDPSTVTTDTTPTPDTTPTTTTTATTDTTTTGTTATTSTTTSTGTSAGGTTSAGTTTAAGGTTSATTTAAGGTTTAATTTAQTTTSDSGGGSGSGSGAPKPKPKPKPLPQLVATVGPGAAITLMRNGKAVHSLHHGRYKVTVHDRTKAHDFHLTGPGVNAKTTLRFVGQKVWTLALRAGSYTFRSDARSGPHGAFRVT